MRFLDIIYVQQCRVFCYERQNRTALLISKTAYLLFSILRSTLELNRKTTNGSASLVQNSIMDRLGKKKRRNLFTKH